MDSLDRRAGLQLRARFFEQQLFSELDGGKHHHHGSAEHAHHHEHGQPHEHHNHGPETAKDQRAAAPAVAGWMAVLGLTIHTFMNGVGLAGAVHAEMGSENGIPAAVLPGLALFLAIVLHKPADALAISMVLSRKGVSRNTLTLVQLGFALMVPIGAAAFALTLGSIQEDIENQVTGAALAFSAGTFLFIALSDLLPEVQFHRHDRVPLFLTLAAGVVLMGGIGILEGEKEKEKRSNHNPAAEGKPDERSKDAGDDDHHRHGHDDDHGHKHKH